MTRMIEGTEQTPTVIPASRLTPEQIQRIEQNQQKFEKFLSSYFKMLREFKLLFDVENKLDVLTEYIDTIKNEKCPELFKEKRLAYAEVLKYKYLTRKEQFDIIAEFGALLQSVEPELLEGQATRGYQLVVNIDSKPAHLIESIHK